MILPCLFIAPTVRRGRGVFTSQKLVKDQVIEISPVIVLSAAERIKAEETGLYDYIFEWGARKKLGALGLGYISLYNHSHEANCEYEMDFDSQLMTIRTLRALEKGEELTINYTGGPAGTHPVWFSLR